MEQTIGMPSPPGPLNITDPAQRKRRYCIENPGWCLTGVYLKLENAKGEVVKRSWLVTLYFMKSKYEYSTSLY